MKKILLLIFSYILLQTIQTSYAQDNSTHSSIFTKIGSGKTQTAPVQLNCPCMLKWKITKEDSINSFYLYLMLEPSDNNDGDNISVAGGIGLLHGEYYLPTSGKYTFQVNSMTEWEIRVEQNYKEN